MAYLSELIGKPVTDLDGMPVGILKDLIASKMNDVMHPVVVAAVVKKKVGEILIPKLNIVVLLAPAIPLNCHVDDIQPYVTSENDIYLARDVLDKQIIDTDDIRVVRVNDVELVRVNGSVVASNVDIGTLGILRRIGLAKAGQKVMGFFKHSFAEKSISWDDVELLPDEKIVRLRVPSDRITELHPADIANIISDMNRAQTSQFIDSLNLEQLADTLEEVEEDFQVSLVKNMSDEKVADVLEEMSPDEAADLLAELPPERSEKLIALMEIDEAEDVRKLLAYPDESAGGIMTTEYVAVSPELNAEQAIQFLRENADEAETIFYVYVVDSAGCLVGVFSLSDLILSKPETPVTEFMHWRVVTVNLLDEQDHVAQMITKYNLLAIPVVDDNKVLHGIVTSDDALDKIIPTAWKKRLPRYFR